ncbi:sensor histidine kinase [Vallitalea okinawensis]|uniref:sensor histidine kinase n=1 Tax=Vallitalea okinawensis TaxID=2078660 RepID=UPI000CFD4BD8|nr:sensor histidine kinase [Vallitalea okinawensis]
MLKRKQMKIRYQYLIAILITTVIYLLILQSVNYFYTSSIIKEKLITLSNQNLEQIGSRIDTVIEDMIIASNAIVLDDSIIDILLDEEEAFFVKMRQVESKVGKVEAANLYPYTVEITLIDFNENVYTTGDLEKYRYDKLVQEDWYMEALDSNGYFLWIGPTRSVFNDYTDANGMTLVRLIRKDYYQPCGVLVIHLYNEKKVKHILRSDEELDGTRRLLLNENGEVILSSGSFEDIKDYANELMQYIPSDGTKPVDIKDENVFISTQSIPKTQWTLVQTIPYDSIMSDEIGFRNFFIFINILFFLIIGVITYFISGQLTKSHRQLSKLMQRVEEGDFAVKSNITGSYEVNMLSSSFNAMIDKINDLIQKIKIESELRQKVKLEALQAQINPHFLLNTLNGIKWLCIIEEAKTAEGMLRDLGVLLEGIMGKYNEFITIEEERKCLESYIRLQKMRYGNIFTVEFDIPEKYAHIKIPVLLLQPIIENSILYAFEDKEDVGLITVRIREEDAYIVIEIRDNGIGFDSKVLTSGIDKQPRENYSSIGIKNVEERIKLYYGDDCSLTIHSMKNQGTTVTIRIKDKLMIEKP